MRVNSVCVLTCLFLSMPALAEQADSPSDSNSFPVRLWQNFKANTAETWLSPQHHEIYLPIFTWHLPFAWDSDKRDQYNEHPWGGGYGLSRYDAEGDWHALYLMVFKDSHYEWEPVGGYAYEKIWRPLSDSDDLKLGLGLTAGITMRDEWHYLPVPVVLPLASVSYRDLTLQTTYVPGTSNKGNVLFTWLRWEFD